MTPSPPTPASTDHGLDARLMAGVAAGQEQAFVDLYARRHADVYRFAFAMARSRSLAQDVVQEVFLAVLEGAARFDGRKGSVRAWLFGCARHVVIDRLRLERRWTDQIAETAEPDGHADRVHSQQRVARLHAAVTELPIEYREAVVLCDLEELSYADAATVLGCPIGTVRSRLHRARALLARSLTAEAGRPAAGEANAHGLTPREVCS